jgi:type I restriction enzyme S subunit
MATIQNQRPLPPAWRWVRLGEVIAEAQPGFACGARDLKGVVQLRMNNVDTRGNMVWKEFIRVPAEESVVNEYQLRTGDVLFNNTNSVELVGKSALFLGFREPVVYSNHFTRLRALAEQLDPQYFAAWLLHQWQLKVFENICNRWIGQSAVKNDKLLALGIPLPPLEEQKRVAAILNEQIAAVERARAAAKALPAAYLRAVFSSPEAQQWPGRSLRDVTTRITDGTHQPPPFTRQGVPFLFVRNIVGGQIDFSVDNYVSRETYEKLTERCSPERGDVLYSAVGSFGVAVVVETDLPFTFQRHIAHLKLNHGVINPFYLVWYLNSPAGKRQSDSAALGGAQRTVTLKSLGDFVVPVPNLEVQNRLVDRLSGQMVSAGRTRKAIEEESDAINKLPAALLRRAFSGGL